MSFIESLLSPEFIRAFAWTLFHSLWQGGLITLIAAGLMITLRRHRPGIRYAILYLSLMLLPVFFAGTFLMTYNRANIGAIDHTETLGTFLNQDNGIDREMPFIAEGGSNKSWLSQPVHLFEYHAKWLVLIWFTGFFIFLLRFSGSWLYVYRLKNYKVYQVEEQWKTKLGKLSERLGLCKPVRLAESALARIPMTIGYLRPVILLPIGTLSGVPPQQIDAILSHELAHILRKDYLLNIIQSVMELLFFYHPVTWWLSRLIRQEREHICDDIAVAINKDHLNYIKALTTMEELNSRSPLLANAMIGTKKQLLFRVKRLVTPMKLRKGLSEGVIAFILLISLIFTLSLNALSLIPNAFDLTGRESGERIFNFLPFNPSYPDTIIATSKSGKVRINVYTDSTSQVQQEKLDRMVESLDAQTQHYGQATKSYRVEVEKSNAEREKCEGQRRVVVIGISDSATWTADSVIVIYNDLQSSLPENHFEFRTPPPGCPTPNKQQEFNYHFSDSDLPERDNIRATVFAFRNDSIDTIIYIGPGEPKELDNIEEIRWSEVALEDQMREIEMNIEVDYPDEELENLHYYFNQEVPPPPPQSGFFSPEHQLAPAEVIIRQELRDDGLLNPDRKYIIELDSKSMYINGVKQQKDIYRKYKRLAEGLDNMSLDDGGAFRIIF